MRREKNDAIFGSLASSAAGNRGHRSVDENYLSAAVAADGKQPGHSRGINIKGWNNSTRASPLWRHRLQDKENGKVVVPKKFRDVQSKLTAPIYSQRRSQAAGAPGLGAGPLQSSSGILNMPQAAAEQPFLEESHHEGLGADARVPLDALQFVTMRRRCEAETPIGFEGPMGWTAAQTRGSQGVLGLTGDAVSDESKLQVFAADRSPQPHLSPHPSVAALYQYAQEVRSPVSDASKPRAPETLPEGFGAESMARADGIGSEAQNEELTCSFASWLTYMNLDTVPLPDGAIAKLRALWHKAKEATGLQACDKELPEAESLVAQQGLDTAACNADIHEVKAGAQEDPQSPKACLQATLLEAEQRPVQLAVSSPTANLASAHKAQLATDVGACSDTPSAYPASPVSIYHASPAASVRTAADVAPPSTDRVSVEDDANSASVGSWNNQEQDPDRAIESCPTSILHPPATGRTSCSNLDLSPSRTTFSQQAASSVSLGSQMRRCDSTSASYAAGTPGLSVLSRSPEAIPFSVWANGINNSPSKGKPASPSPSSAGAVRDDTAAADAAELHSVTRAAGSIAPSPGFSQSRSAGLSVASRLPQPVAFEAWERAQRERAALAASVSAQNTPAADGSVVSPAPSAGLRNAKPECTPIWPPTAESTPMHPPKGVKPSEGAAGGAQIRSNPLFECDSPASSMTTPLPERTDAMPGLAATPSPAHKPAIPSLASTPMSDGEGLLSRLASPLGSELNRSLTTASPCLLDGLSPGLFGAGDIGDMPTPVARVWSTPLTLCSPTELRHGDSSSLLSEGQAPSFGDMPDVAADSCPSPVEPCPEDAGGPSCQTAAEDAAESSPADMCAEAPTIDEGIDTSNDGLTELPTAEATPAAANGEGSPTLSASASPISDTVCGTGMADVAAPGTAAEVACGETETGQSETSPQRQPKNVAPDVAPTGSASAFSSPSPVAVDAVKEPASGNSSAEKAAVARRGGLTPRAQSYPNTPSAKWPATPTSVYVTPYEEFPTPRSQTSYLSGVQPTAMRRLSSSSTPHHAPASGVPTPAAFTFGLGPGRPLGNGARVEAPTPDLVLGGQVPDPEPAGAACSEMATPASQPARPGMVGFGSPLPLLLTPLQMRVLDQLASQVIAAMSPIVQVASPASNNGSPVDENALQDCPPVGSDAQAAAFAGYNFAQMLSHIHSPMPVPMQQQARRAAAAAPDCAAPVQQGACSASEVHAEAAIPVGADHQAGAAVAAEQEPASANAQPPASPMPSFTKLMAFLNAARRPAAEAARNAADTHEAQPLAAIVESDPASSAVQFGPDASVPPVDVSDAVAAAAVYSFAQLVAHLRAPKLNGPSGRPNPAPYQPTAASVLAAPACVDSPVTAAGAQDSPATSEAASFGFSTAAKQMEIRRTPATGTPGEGGVSFMRWARDTPLTFHLDSDAPRASGRGRHTRTPSTPVSFSFGARLNTAPSLEEATPAVGVRGNPDLVRMSRAGVVPLHFSASAQLSESGEHVSPDGQKGHQRTSSLGLGDMELPGDETNPFTMAGGSPAIVAMPGFAAAGLVASPAFSFGQHLRRLPFTAATPAAIFGPRARDNNCGSNTPDRENANQLHTAFGASPAPSLGPWAFVPGRPAPTGANADASPTPSELAFTFGHYNAQALATPVWAGLAGAAAAAAAALTADKADSDAAWNMAAALEQVVVAMSPTFFGMGGAGSPADTPGVNQRVRTPASGAEAAPVQAAVPGAAAFWAALLGGGLQSPMPAGVHSRLYPDSIQTEQKLLQQDRQPTLAAAPSLDTVTAVGGVAAAETSPTVAVSETMSAASPIGSAASGVQRDAAAATLAAANEISGFGCEQCSSQGEAPPPYEDLPDLIARGLCLSASTSVQLAASKSAKASTIMTCSSVGENHTPMGYRALGTGEATPAIASETTVASAVPAVASTEAVAAGSPPTQRLFRPVVGRLALPQLAATGASASSEPALASSAPLVLESVSDSNRSAVDMASVNVARTTEPLPTPSRMMHTAFSGCIAAVHTSAASVRESPVLSFHAASMDRATDTSSPQIMEMLFVPPGPFSATLHVDIGTAASCSPMTLPGAIRSAAGEERTAIDPSSSYKPALSTMDPPSIFLPGLDSGFGSGVGSPSSDAAFGSTELRSEVLPPADMGSPERAAVAALTGQQVDSAGVEAPMEGWGSPSAVARDAVGTDGVMQSEPYDAGAAGCSAAVCCPSPPPSVVVGNDAWQHSPTTFSYLTSGTLPATPLTAELASASKGGPSMASQQPIGGCGQFWAPSPSGRTAATSERVMLEASNRRIRTNADLLLDFQGSPGQPMHGNPTASASSAVTPRMKSQGLLGARSGVGNLRKSWDLGLSPTANAPSHGQNAAQASAPPNISNPSVTATSTNGLVIAADAMVAAGKGGAVLSAKSPTGLPVGSRARMLLPGQGPPLQQLVAAGIDDAFASAAATVMQPGGVSGEHMPISRRLGMWPSAVWSVPGLATATKQTEADAAAPSGSHAAAQPQGVAVMPTPKAAPTKPLVASRDVQTTPSLGRCVMEAAHKAPGGLKAGARLQGAAIAPATSGSAAIPRPGGFRSRIPAPSSLAAPPPSSSLDASAVPTIARSESSGIPAQSGSSVAATSGDEDTEESAPVERVIRRRRLLTSAAAAGGAQRVPVKGAVQRAGPQSASGANGMAEDEMRRRARVLGVRISPYMKSKAPRVRLSEAQQPKKG